LGRERKTFPQQITLTEFNQELKSTWLPTTLTALAAEFNNSASLAVPTARKRVTG
jgi:hypothetical protein